MCLAKKYAEQINEIIHKAHEDLLVLRQKESELDKEVSRKYHEIETTNFNASEGYCLAKSLQETLQKRRTTKHELKQMNTFVRTICDNGIDKKIRKINSTIDKKEDSYLVYSDGFNVSIGDVLNEKLQLN